jgi:hypothetical protein
MSLFVRRSHLTAFINASTMSTMSTTDRLLVNKYNQKLQMAFLLFKEASNELNALIESINSLDESLPDLQKLMGSCYQHELNQLQLVIPELHELNQLQLVTPELHEHSIQPMIQPPFQQPIQQSTQSMIQPPFQQPIQQSTQPMIQSPTHIYNEL